MQGAAYTGTGHICGFLRQDIRARAPRGRLVKDIPINTSMNSSVVICALSAATGIDDERTEPTSSRIITSQLCSLSIP